MPKQANQGAFIFEETDKANHHLNYPIMLKPFPEGIA